MMTLRELERPALIEILRFPTPSPIAYKLFQTPLFEIPHLFSITVLNTAFKLLKGQSDMIRVASQVLETCEEVVSRRGATASILLYGYKGMEQRERETLVVKFEVYNKTFNEILSIWDEASKAVQEKLPYKKVRKLVISFERARSDLKQSSL